MMRMHCKALKQSQPTFRASDIDGRMRGQISIQSMWRSLVMMASLIMPGLTCPQILHFWLLTVLISMVAAVKWELLNPMV